MRNCYLTFDSLANDLSVSEILRTSSLSEFAYFERVVKICIDLASKADIRAFTQEVVSIDQIKLEDLASQFVRYYVRQHCKTYDELLKEVDDTKDFSDEVELDKDAQAKKTRNIIAK